MPNEDDVKLNLTGSIKDLANTQQYNPTTNAGFQTNSVISNMSPTSIGRSNTGNQPFTPTQFAKLMDVLATMTNRMEAAHGKTHIILEKMQISLATRLETVYKQLIIMNKRSEEVNKRQMELQKASETNTKDLTFRLTGFLGAFGEDFRKSIIQMQRYVSTEDPAEAARKAMIRLLGSAKFLKGFIGYEAEEFKGKMKPMPFTTELYYIVLNMPKYFDTLSRNIRDTEVFMQRGILDTRHREIVSLFTMSNNILQSIKDIHYNYSKAMLEYSLSNTILFPKLKKDIALYFKKSEKVETNYHKIYKEKLDEQIEGMKELKITFTDKVDDLLKQTIAVSQGFFQVSRYLFSPRSLFGKLFWGYLGYRGIASILSPVFEKIYAISSPVVNAISTAFSYITRGILRKFGIEIKEGEKVTTVLKDSFLSALKTFWSDYAWPTLEKGIGTLLALYAAKNLIFGGVVQGGLWGKGPAATKIAEERKFLYRKTEKFGYGTAQKLGVPDWLASGVYSVMGSIGSVFESMGIMGLSETGTAMKGIGRGFLAKTRKPVKVPPGKLQKLISAATNMAVQVSSNILSISGQALGIPAFSAMVPGIKAQASTMAGKTGVLAGKAATVGKSILNILGSGLKIGSKFLKLIPMLGPIAIGLSLAMPMLSSGLTFLRESLLPSLFGGKGNVPRDIRTLVGESLKKITMIMVDMVLGFIKNIPDYLKKTANVLWQITLGIKDALIAMIKGLFGWIFTHNEPNKGKALTHLESEGLNLGTRKTENIKTKGETKPQTPEEAAIKAKEMEIQEETLNTAKDQGKKLGELLDYFKGGAFTEDMVKVAEGIGKTFGTLFELMGTIKDFAVGKMGGFLSSLGATLGGFITGLVGEEKGLTFLATAQQIAKERGFTGVSQILSSGRKSILQIMQENTSLESEASKTNYLAAEMQFEAAKLAYKRESGINMRQSSVTKSVLTAMTGATRISSGYGWRSDPFTGETKFHHGIDLPVPENTPIYSGFDGIVKRATSQNTGGYGLLVEVDYPKQNMTAIFAHLNKVAVTKGQKVRAGDMLGLSGSTGRSKGEHVHFEIRDRKTGKSKPPLEYLDALLVNEGQYVFESPDKTFAQRLEQTGMFSKIGNTKTYISKLNDLVAGDHTRAFMSNYDSVYAAYAAGVSLLKPKEAEEKINIENLNIINTVASNESNTNNVDNSKIQQSDEEQANRVLFSGGILGGFPAYDLGLE